MSMRGIAYATAFCSVALWTALSCSEGVAGTTFGAPNGGVQKNNLTLSAVGGVLLSFTTRAGTSVNVNGVTPIDTFSVNCPFNKCIVLIEDMAQVGLASQPTPYEWAILGYLDGTCGLGCGVMGLVRTDTNGNDGGYEIGNMRETFVVTNGSHTIDLKIYTGAATFLSRWEGDYTVFKCPTC